MFQDLLTSYLNTLESDQIFLFDMKYNSVLKLLHRLGEQALKKRVYPHLLRHSSATYYANVIPTAAQFNYMFGWSMHSKMAQRYIDKAGIHADAIAEKTINNVISKERGELKKIFARNKFLEEEVKRQKEKLERVENQVEVVVDYLKKTGQLKHLVQG